MTIIPLQDGKVVLRSGKVGGNAGCCCECGPPCGICPSPSLTVTVEGFAGGGGACNCNSHNRSYILHRGAGYPPTALVRIRGGGRGYGAVIVANLVFNAGSGAYTVGSVRIEERGAGYTENAYGEIAIRGGAVACNDPPVFEVEVQRVIPPQPPVVEFLHPFSELGYGAKFEIVWSEEDATAGSETWSVAALNVLRGGRGYRDRTRVYIKQRSGFYAVIRGILGDGTNGDFNFVGMIVIDHAEPILEQVLVDSEGGAGAEFSYSWTLNQQILDDIGETELDYRYWQLTNLTVTSGGFGYALGDRISYSLANAPGHLGLRPSHDTYGDTLESPFLWGYVAGVDENGSITAIETLLNAPPSHARTDGIIQRVIVEEGGLYYGHGGIKRVTVLDGGTIWPFNPCSYSACYEVPCGEETICRQVDVSVNVSGGSLGIRDNGISVLSASFSAGEDSGPCITGGSSSAGSITFAGGDCVPGTITVSQGGDGAPDPLACCLPGGPDGPGCPPASLLWIESDDPCTPPFECPPNGLIQSACGFGDANGLRVARGAIGLGQLPPEWQGNTTFHLLENGFFIAGGAGARARVQHFTSETIGQVTPFGGPQVFRLESTDFVVGFQGRRWQLFTARVYALSSIFEFDTVWNAFLGVWETANLRVGSRVYNGGTLTDLSGNQFTQNGEVWFDRDFCIAGSGDAVELSISKSRLQFGDIAFSYADNGFVNEGVLSADVPTEPIEDFEFKFIIREWECQNPLP